MDIQKIINDVVAKLKADPALVKRIAEKMLVSINSVQTYAKSLYRKLDIHSKQELIDLVTSRRD